MGASRAPAEGIEAHAEAMTDPCRECISALTGARVDTSRSVSDACPAK